MTEWLPVGNQEEADARLQRWPDALPTLIARISPTLCAIAANAAAVEWLGTQPQALPGIPACELFGQAAFEILRKPLLRSLAGEEARFDAWLPLRHGGRRYCNIEYIPDRGADGEILGVVALITDLTNQASQRERARRLEQANRRSNELLSLIGHELLNPLTPVRNVLDRLFLGDADHVTHARALQLIDRQTQHMERLVRDLLDVARIKRGSIELIKAPCDLRRLVQESVQVMEAVMSKHRHQIQVELPDAPVLVYADETRLVQVLNNILHNAAQYTDDGGRIRVRLAADQRTACLQIEDNGRGIEAEAMLGLFDAYGRVRCRGQRADGGLGLGLSLVKQFVELHGGWVEAHSDGPHCGSRFTVSLPLHNRPRAPALKPAATASLDRAVLERRRILVVDDNADVVDSTVMLLGVMGQQASGVYTGSDALASISAATPDLVLLDIGLPDIDGIEVARRLAAMPQRAALKLVAMSGFAVATLGDAAALFDAHLLKPAGRDALRSVLHLDDQTPRPIDDGNGDG